MPADTAGSLLDDWPASGPASARGGLAGRGRRARRRSARPLGGDRPARPRAGGRPAHPQAWARPTRPQAWARPARRPAGDRPSRQDLARPHGFLSRNSPHINAPPCNMPESMSRTCTGPVLHPSGGGAAMDMRPATSSIYSVAESLQHNEPAVFCGQPTARATRRPQRGRMLESIAFC